MDDRKLGRTNFIRTHPLVSLWIVLAITPLPVGAWLLAVRYMPACSEWRKEVQASAQSAIRERYIGFGNREAVDDAYRSEGSGYDDIMNSLLGSAEHELADSRPFACI